MIVKEEMSVKEVADSIISSNKNANKFIELLVEIEKSNTKAVVEAIEACVRVCCHWIEKDYVSEDGGEDNSAEEKFKEWVRLRVREFMDELCVRFSDEKNKIKSAAWQGVESILKSTSDHIISSTHNLYNFPTSYLSNMLSTLISSDLCDMEHLQSHLHDLCGHDDVRYFVLKTLTLLLSDTTSHLSRENIFIILQNLNMPLKSSSSLSLPLSNFFVNKELIDVTLMTKYSDEREHRKLFSALWIKFLNMTMSVSLITDILSIIDTEVMPFMTNPLQLADYLVMFYRMGGTLSMVALGGLFVLMNKYNLEYPDFYSHLYSQLQQHPLLPSTLTSAFFSRLDLFLTSTHLPASLVASFIKRLSRLALISPSTTQPFLISLIINLTIRHPNCCVLMDLPKDLPREELTTDPFNNDEEDPTKTNAINSSLWEIKFLQNHKLACVSNLANKINNPTNNRREINNHKYISLDYSVLSMKESKSELSNDVPIRATEPYPPSSHSSSSHPTSSHPTSSPHPTLSHYYVPM